MCFCTKGVFQTGRGGVDEMITRGGGNFKTFYYYFRSMGYHLVFSKHFCVPVCGNWKILEWWLLSCVYSVLTISKRRSIQNTRSSLTFSLSENYFTGVKEWGGFYLGGELKFINLFIYFGDSNKMYFDGPATDGAIIVLNAFQVEF